MQKMKNFIYTFILLLSISTHLFGDDKADAWRVLSARSQNFHGELLIMSQDMGIDASMYEEELQGIDNALNHLVGMGELKSKKIRLKSINEVGELQFDKVLQNIDFLSKKYGVFVALEMCDIGAHLRFMTIQPDEGIELHLRLPKKDLIAFEVVLNKLGLLVKK